MRRTIQDRARRRTLADAAATANTPVTGPPRISPEALAFQERHGTSTTWCAEDWKTYLELGGAS